MLKSALFPLLALTLTAQTPAPKAKKTVKAPKEAAPAAQDEVIASIGEKVIRQSDFDAFLDLAVPAQQRAIVGASPDMKAQYLNRFLNFSVLAAKARQEKVDASPAFQRKLALREQETLVQELMQRDSPMLQQQVKPSEEELKAYFEAHKDKFATPGRYSVRHILVSSKEATGTEKAVSDEEAKAKAAKVLAELKGGRKIQDLAKEYSDDPGSKDKGGLYENIAYGQFVPEFEAAVKKQAPGEVGEPVKTQFGYHIIQVEKKIPAEAAEFDKVKEKVRQEWMPQRQEDVFGKYISAAKQSVGFKDMSAQVAKDKEAAR